jgi:hypothetical protein
MNATIINKFGRIVGWNNITARFLNRNLEGITELEYDDNVDMANEQGAGKYPIGQSEMNYTAKCSITLFSEEMDALQAIVPPGLRIQDIPPFPIVIEYDRNGVIKTDTVQNCKIMNVGRAVKQGDGKIVHKCNVLTSHIDWG